MDLTPDANVVKAVATRYGALIHRLGDELGERPLVLPNGEFFPDRFRGDERGLERLVKRMLGHADLEDIPIRIEVVGDVPEAAGGSCGSGACGSGGASSGGMDKPRLEAEGDGWILRVPGEEVADAMVLTTNLAIVLGHLFLLETAEEETDLKALAEDAELSAVALGFGVLLLEGSYMYKKSCGGPSVGKMTRLSCPELATALALFTARSKKARTNGRNALAELGTTQRSAYKGARSLLKLNPTIKEALRERPEVLSAGHFVVKEESAGWFGGKKRAAEPDSLEEMEALAASLGPVKKTRKRKADPEQDALSALVADALNDAHAPADAE